MDRYISYKAIENLLDKEVGAPPALVYRDAYARGLREDIKSLPVADVAEVRYGRWIDVTPLGCFTCGGNPVYGCSECGYIYGSHKIFPSAKYCQECGAKMSI